MNAAPSVPTGDAPPESVPDAGAAIASLRAAGAGRFDPVQLRYIEVLAERTSAQQGSARLLLDARLARALAAFQERFAAARSGAREIVERSTRQYPHAARELQRLYGAGEFRSLRRFAAGLDSSAQAPASPLALLLRQLEQMEQMEQMQPMEPQQRERQAEAAPARHARARRGLDTIKHFKHTLSKLSVHRQVAQALEQAPKNAGPINSHMLVLRSLALMRDISPDYLNRFITYADALLCLDQGEKEKPAAPKKQQGARASRK